MIPLPLVSNESPPTPAMVRKEATRQKTLARTAARHAENAAASALLYYRFRIVKARMEAHGIPITSYLGPTLLACSPLEAWLNTANEGRILAHYADEVPKRFIDAARANPTVRENTKDASIVANPPVALRFEQASVYATFGEALAASQHKNWGAFVAIEPIPADIPLDRRIQYGYHGSSRYNQRVEQRRYMKKRLGKGLSKLVMRAMRATKRDFLAGLAAEDAAGIARRLKLDPSAFWRAAKGAAKIEREPFVVQMELLFPEE